MATRLKELLPLLLLITFIVNSSWSADLPKPSYARTLLKVSRSLPGETEELKVRTSEGNFATLIVKRRDKSAPFSDLEGSKTVNQNDQVQAASESEHSKITDKTPTEGRGRDESRRHEEAQQVERVRTQLNEAKNSEHANTRSFRASPIRINDDNLDYKNWTPLSKDGKALKIEDDTTEQYPHWRPVQSNFGDKSYANGRYEGMVFARDFQNRGQRKLNIGESDRQQDQIYYAFLPHQPRPLVRTNIGANLMKNRDAKNVPPEVTIRSEINVKSLPKRSPMTIDADGTPVIHGKRVPDEPIDKIQVWRNARVINNKLVSDAPSTANEATHTSSDNNAERKRFERFFDDVNRRYGKNYDGESRNVYFEWDPKNYQNDALKADVYETRNENYRSNIQKRMLHPESTVTYPNSQLYTPESQKIAPLTLKPGVRAPVLQYAHPELGVQPAKIVKNEKKRPDNFPENQHSFTEQRQKKKYVLNDKTIVDSYSKKNYYPNQHFYGLKRPNDAPFWVKLSENLKNQLSTGVERVSQFTRPVFDPLVEATHKISQNLGLSKKQEAQGKIGTSLATGSSILIPALGLVASGAALGIGAVAVGRYLDVDVLKRSMNEADPERQRSLNLYVPIETIAQTNGNIRLSNGEGNFDGVNSSNVNKNAEIVLMVEEDQVGRQSDKQPFNTVEGASSKSRRRRSMDDLDIFKVKSDLHDLVRRKRFDQRKGADSMDEIVEIDVPVRGSIDINELIIPKREMQNGDVSIILLKDKLMSSELAGNGKVESIKTDIAEESRMGSSPDMNQKRIERSVDGDQDLNDALQNLENAEVAEIAHITGDWTNTPCAKRIFCDTMIRKNSDAVMLMEKKMAALLGLIQPSAAALVSSHFEEVMDAVRRHNCSRFLCPQARPGNVFF